MKTKLGALAYILLFPIVTLTAQSSDLPSSHPKVGQPMPDFVLKRVDYFSKTEATLEDFRGKWLFLDFWFPGCVSCIKAFPKVNQLQAAFKDEIQFVMVGLNSRMHRHVERVYEGLRKKMGLNLVVAYDSVLVETWQIYSMPHIIVVDPQGIVRYITSGVDLTSQKLERLLEGEHITLKPKDSDVTAGQMTKSLCLGGFDSASLYESHLMHWTGEEHYSAPIDFQVQKGSYFRAVKVPLVQLYNLAYVGKAVWDMDDSLYAKFYPKPILNLSDSSFFQYDYKADTGMYNYYLKPLDKASSKSQVMNALQKELRNIFGYDVYIQDVQIPIWKLVASSDARSRVRTKGGKYHYYESPSGFSVRNFPAERLLNLVVRYISNKYTIFVDETGLSGNIDLSVDALMTDWNDLCDGLRRNGFDLVRGFKEMKVLVINDPEVSRGN